MFQKWHTNRNLRISVHLAIVTLYLIYFLALNENQGLTIKKFGPTMTKAGQSFNLQPHGTSALWIQTEGLSNNSIVAVWGDTQLDTFVHLEKQLLTVRIPEELFSTPGDFEIYLIDFENNIRSNKVIFTVHGDHNPKT